MSIPEQQDEQAAGATGNDGQATGGGGVGEGGQGGGPVDTRRVTPPELPLGWTQMGPQVVEPSPADRVRYPWDVVEQDNTHVEFPPPDGELVVVGTAGQKITRMGGDQLVTKCGSDLTKLVLRSHLITKMDGIGGFQKLELLELYDNQIEVMECLDGGDEGKPGVTLRVLDMSYNIVRDMNPVNLCPNLEELFLANNKIKVISGISHLKKLRKIDLGANRIRVMPEEELSGLENLEELWLGKNKIESIGGISKLTKLRRLDVQSNRLVKVENLEAQVDTLEELYLSHNGINDDGASCETGLALNFSRLNTIDMSRNRLKSTKPFAHLLALEELWISGNGIATFEDVEHITVLGTRDGACLEGIYLEMNPVASEFEYRKKLALMLPSLKQIDADTIGGNVAHHGIMPGGGSGSMTNMVARMRELQDAAILRARAEQQQQQEGDQGSGDES